VEGLLVAVDTGGGVDGSAVIGTTIVGLGDGCADGCADGVADGVADGFGGSVNSWLVGAPPHPEPSAVRYTLIPMKSLSPAVPDEQNSML
jgi:hypothetical protein